MHAPAARVYFLGFALWIGATLLGWLPPVRQRYALLAVFGAALLTEIVTRLRTPGGLTHVDADKRG
ncbi:MAG TPA: hypothetical protein VJR92_01105 [Gemmatimonadaceae bacterium]|nr:hypothetical protein [Gemmatimonadaceae bacterium]